QVIGSGRWGPYRQASPPPARHPPAPGLRAGNDVSPFIRRPHGELTMSFKNLFKSLTLSSSHRRPARRSSSARLNLEALERRDVPSAYSIAQIPMTPHDINADGLVVGDGGLWQDGTLTNLGSLAGPGGSCTAYAINDAGQIVGSTYNPDGSLSASA